MPTTALTRIAATLVLLEGLALAILTGWQVVELAAGGDASVTTGVALAVLTAIGAIAVLAFGAAIWRGQGWGRSGGVVVQLLVLASAISAATSAYVHPLVAVAVSAFAVVTLVILGLVIVRSARTRR